MNERLLMFLIPVLLLAVFTTCMMLYKYNTPGSDQLKAKDSPKAFSFETVQDSCICNNGRNMGRNEWEKLKELAYIDGLLYLSRRQY